MGSCFSKKTNSSSPKALPDPPDQLNIHNTQAADKKAEEETVKKEILVVKPRKSHDTDRRSEEEKARGDQTVTASCASDVPSEAADPGNSSATSTNNEMNSGLLPNGGVVVRTSSCTKEEVDAILIQCGRLSRSASAGRAAVSGSGGSCGRKYSGSKRSYDFDHEASNCDKDKKKGDGIEDNDFNDNVGGGDEERLQRRHRHRQRQSRPSSSPARRRTPSRERDHQQQRSGSRERGSSSGGSGGGGSRRVSRSPGRRLESSMSNASGSNNCGTNSSNNKPAKMVSVPATISSLAMDKSNNGGGGEAPSAPANKRITAKRNAGDSAMGCRSAASPRSRSPARANVRAANENQQQPLSLSRSNSRKADQSPYRRNPLGEIDQNCIGFEGPQKPSVENVKNSRTGSDKVSADNKIGTLNSRAKEQQQQHAEEGLQPPRNSNVAVTVVVPSGGESLKPPQALTRSRSSRLSRDLEINPDTLLNPSPPPSYTTLLLEDIQNFHHKSAPAISLPPCVTKACSILEAVADLNSSTGRRSPTTNAEQLNKGLEAKKDPFVESEVLVSNDLMEPSFHRYVTLRRGTVGVGDDDMEEQESSGSNSFVGGGGAHQNWVSSSSSWEPNSADSTGRWTSSRSNGREDESSPLGFQRHDADEAPRRLGEKNHQQIGFGRGRVGTSRGLLHSMPTTATLAAVAST